MTRCSFEEKDDDDNEGGLLLRNAAEMVPRNNSRIATPRTDWYVPSLCPHSTMMRRGKSKPFFNSATPRRDQTKPNPTCPRLHPHRLHDVLAVLHLVVVRVARPTVLCTRLTLRPWHVGNASPTPSVEYGGDSDLPIQMHSLPARPVRHAEARSTM